MTRVRVASRIQWSLRDEGLLLIEAGSGRPLALDCLQGAVWELLHSRGQARAAQLMALVGGWTTAQAAGYVQECVSAWLADGWLEREDADGEHRDSDKL